MAHGFLSPQAVTGEGLGIPYKKLFDGIKSLFRKDLRVVNANVKEVRDLIEGKNQAKLPPAATKILGGSSVKGLLGPASGGLANRSGGLVEKNATDIDLKTGKKLLTPGGPRLQGGGVTSAAATSINPDTFFNRAQTGVGSDGEYLTKAQRIADFKAGRQPRQTDGPSITPDSGVDIVAAVNRNTEAIVALSNLTKEQTKEQRSMHNEQQAQSDKLANRALARAEEKQLEKGSDLSGFTKPETFQKLLPGAGGTGGGSGGGPIGGIGGKVGAKKVAQAVTKRGAQRVGTRLAAKYGGKAAAKAAGKYGAKAATKMGIKGAAKIGGAAVAKSVGKKIPLVGLGLGAVFAAQRALQGDFVGAGLELASGAASTVPGIGTAGSIGIDAALAARDMGMTPFANGGIITQPTAGLVGEAGQEGIFPLEGSRGKKTFEMFGEGLIRAQKSAKDEFAKIQAAGLKFYFQNQDGFKFFGNILKTAFAPFLEPLKALSGLGGGILNSLLGGPANAAGLGLTNVGGGGTGEQNLAAFLSTMEASGNQNQADAFQVMLNRAADAQAGGSMKAYGTSLGDQITAREQFSPLSSAIYGVSADSAAAAKYGPISRALGSSPEERKKRLLEIASQPDGLVALQKLFGGGSASDAAKVLQDFKSGGSLSQQSASDIGSMVSFRGYRSGSGDFNRGAGGNFFFDQGSKGKVGSLSQVSPGEGPGSPAAAGNLAAAAQQLKGMSTADGPDGGRNGCVYAVNKVFSRAGITPPWGSSLYVPDAEKSMIDAGWQQIPYGQQQPGDVFVMKDRKSPPQAHIGVATDNRMILSNSSGEASMNWSDTAQGYNQYYGGVGALYRMPGGQTIATANASPSAPGTPLTAEQKAKIFQNSGMSAMSASTITGSTPGPVPASPAPGTANSGTPIMATSAQVASASAIPTATPTIVNNYYGGGGNQPTGVNPNGVSAGIDMDAAGLSAFQDLKIRSLS